MRLYEFDSAIEDAFTKAIDHETGEIIDEDMAERFEQLQIDRDKKIEGIACMIKEFNADALALKAEKDTLAARQRTAENRAASLKRYLEGYLGGEKFESARAAISYRKSVAVNVTDIEAIPKEYLNIKVDANKTAIKNAIKNGDVVAGAELVENRNMVIK